MQGKLSARAIYASSIVWDDHSGFMPHPKADLAQLGAWRAAGVSYLSIDVGFDLFDWRHTVSTAETFRNWILQHGEEYRLVSKASEIREASSSGKLAVTFDIEGMNALDGRVEMLEFYYRLGVRQVLIAYNRRNQAGGGCHDDDVGLTGFGREAIAEMNRLGMFVDVSHCSYLTSMEAIEFSQDPVIFSHSNPRALWNHERNIRDEQIKACAKKGGVIGVVGLDNFLGGAQGGGRRLADHVEYLLGVAGPEHVGIGLDYSFPVDAEETNAMLREHPEFWPRDRGYDDSGFSFTAPDALLVLTEELLRRGHPEAVIRGVLGENFLRLAQHVWK